MNGKISDQPVAELLREISASGLSGTLRLEHERMKAAVYLESGQAVFAASNVRNLRLREYVATRVPISETELSSLANNRSDPALAALLIEKKLANSDTISELFSALAVDVVRLVLSWNEGEWEYDDRSRLADEQRATIDSSFLLLEAARKMEGQLVTSRFLDPEEIISPGKVMPDSARLAPTEGFVLSRVDRPSPLSELILLSGMSEMDAQRTIYGLALAGYLEREAWPKLLRPGPPKPRKVEKPAPPPPAPVAPLPPVEVPEVSIEVFLDRVKTATSHYEVLAVSESAEAIEIKRVYYTLARQYHPDRFHSNAELHAQVESAFARITQAYETVMDPKRRSAYDSKLTAQRKSRRVADSAPKARTDAAATSATSSPASNKSVRAEESFKEGYAALQMGQLGVAITHLAAAAKAAPDESRYRAYYGQALVAQGRSQRLAESEFQAAVKLEPKNASYRLMLAKLYADLQFHKRARAEAERVLEIDPQNSTARELLHKLEGK